MSVEAQNAVGPAPAVDGVAGIAPLSDIAPDAVPDATAPIRMLHVCETAKGGVGTYISLFACFDPRQVCSYVVAPREHVSQLKSSLEIETYPRPRRGAVATFNMICAAQRAVASLDPDVIFCHSAFSLSVVAWFRMTRPRATVLFCPHGLASSRYDSGSIAKRFAQAIEGVASRWPTLNVHVSTHERDLCRMYGYPGRHEVVENALPEAARDARDDLFLKDARGDNGATNVVFVGRLDRQKGLDVLIEAMRLLGDARPDLILHVVGASVNGKADFENLPANIVMHGWIDYRDIDSWYRSADAVIVPSRWEGLPFVVIEALRNGTPVLVSDRSGMPGLIEPGRTGAVFELNSQAIASLLRSLDREALQSMRAECQRSYWDRFGIARYRDEFSALLDRVTRADIRGADKRR